MEPLSEEDCRRILEVSASASMEDITHEYHRLKRIYGEEGGTFDAISMDEFSPPIRRQILQEIEAAYKELCKFRVETPPLPVPAPVLVLERDLPSDGTGLRRAREASGFSLERVVAETNVRIDYLAALEEERFEDLPTAAVYVRGYLTSYLAAIGQSSEQVVSEYMQRHREWLAKKGR
jgi:hypothetical protein